MSTISITYNTIPEAAKNQAQLEAVWLIDDDPHTPDEKFEDKAEPWTALIDPEHEYVVYFHARLPGAQSVTVIAGSRSITFAVPAIGIVKKMFYLYNV